VSNHLVKSRRCSRSVDPTTVHYAAIRLLCTVTPSTRRVVSNCVQREISAYRASIYFRLILVTGRINNVDAAS